MTWIASPILAAFVALLGPGVIFIRSVRGRGTSAIVFASLPWALCLVAASVALAAWEALAGFRKLARAGTGTLDTLAQTVMLPLDLLCAWAMGAGLCIAVAALLQMVAHRVRAEASGAESAADWPGAPGSAASPGSPGSILLLAVSLLVIPTALVHTALHAALDQLLGVLALGMKVSAPAVHLAAAVKGDDMTGLGEAIGAHLVHTGLGAAGLLGVLALLSAYAAFVRFSYRGLAVRSYSLVLASAVCVAAVWTSIDLAADSAWLRWRH